MNQPHQIRPGRLYIAQKPVRDPLYLRFIKSLPCVACLKTWSVDPCHTGPHGIGQKSCDLSCIPLCRRHHRDFDANPREFARIHNLNIPALIQRFNVFYRERLQPRKAA